MIDETICLAGGRPCAGEEIATDNAHSHEYLHLATNLLRFRIAVHWYRITRFFIEIGKAQRISLWAQRFQKGSVVADYTSHRIQILPLSHNIFVIS